jgi:hypothetical protein
MYLVPSQLYRSHTSLSDPHEGGPQEGQSGGDSSACRPPPGGVLGTEGGGGGGRPRSTPPPPPKVASLPPPQEERGVSLVQKGENEKHTFGAAKSRNLAQLGVPGNAVSTKREESAPSAARKTWGSSLDQQSRLQQLTADRLSQLRGTRGLKRKRQPLGGEQEREIIHQLRSLYQKELDVSRRKRLERK